MAHQLHKKFPDEQVKSLFKRYLLKEIKIGYIWIGQKTTQLSGNFHGIGDNFLVVFHVFENSGPSREVYVVFGFVTTVA